MAKVIFTSQIKKNLELIDHWISGSGLVAQYIFLGNDYTLELDQFKTLDLLQKYGFIESHSSLMVQQSGEDGYTARVEWWDFAGNFKLSQCEMRDIIAREMEEKYINEWAKDIKSIPDLIQSF